MRKKRYGKIELVAKKNDGESVLITTDLPASSPYDKGGYVFNDNVSWEIGIWGIAAIICDEKILNYAEETGKKPDEMKAQSHYSKDSLSKYDSLTTSERYALFNLTSADLPIGGYEDLLDEYEKHFCGKGKKNMKEQCKYLKRFKPKFRKAYNEACNRYKASNTTS